MWVGMNPPGCKREGEYSDLSYLDADVEGEQG